MWHYAAVLLLVTAQSVAPPEASTSRAAFSKAEAESFLRKIAVFDPPPARRTRKPPAGPILVTEGEINSYVNLELLPNLPGTVTDVEVRLDHDRLAANGIVDIDQVKRELTLSPWNPLSFLSGRLPVNVAGRYEGTKDGFGRVTVEEVRAGRVPIPVSVVQQLIASLTKSKDHPQGVDLQQPLALPRPMKRLRLLPGKAYLDL